PSMRPLLCSSGYGLGEFSRLGGQKRKSTRSALNVVTNFNADAGSGIKKHIHTRAEFHHADTLSALHGVADLLRENDPAGKQSGNLLENDSVTLAFNLDRILFVCVRAGGVHRIQKLPLLIFGAPYHAGHRS